MKFTGKLGRETEALKAQTVRQGALLRLGLHRTSNGKRKIFLGGKQGRRMWMGSLIYIGTAQVQRGLHPLPGDNHGKPIFISQEDAFEPDERLVRRGS